MAKEINAEVLAANIRMIDKKGEIAFEAARAAGNLDARLEKVSELISGEAFSEKLIAAESTEEVQALFKEAGVELSEDEVNALGGQIAEISKKLMENGGEISEEELAEVVGGSLGGELIGGGAVLGTAGAGAGIGTLICPGVGTCIGLLVGCVGGLALGVEGTARGWFEKAADGVGFIAKNTVKGMKIWGKMVGGWIKSWF